VELDSNDNGIPDWEESLWGLDPKGNGDANKKAIASKKAAAGIDTTEPKSPANATDAFSRQLLSAVLALKQSGSLTPEAITNLAASVGNSVDAHHADPATYTINDIRLTSSSTAQAKAAYKVALKGVIDQYQDVNLGSELGIISDGLSGGGADTLAALGPIAQAYTDISKKIIALPTPPGASLYALALANTSAAMGATLVQIQNLYGDVISGMVGIDDYVKASAASDKASANMKLYFSS